MPSVLHRDSFSPVLLDASTPDPLQATEEQKSYIKEILSIACSDSAFALKAYTAIQKVLTSGKTIPPIVTSLSPSSVEIGDPSFDIHVIGTGFKSDSVIVFNGFDEPTTYVSATELTTGVNMDVWLAAAMVPITVKNSDGVMSDPMTFTFTDAGSVVLITPPDPVTELHKTGESKLNKSVAYTESGSTDNPIQQTTESK